MKDIGSTLESTFVFYVGKNLLIMATSLTLIIILTSSQIQRVKVALNLLGKKTLTLSNRIFI